MARLHPGTVRTLRRGEARPYPAYPAGETRSRRNTAFSFSTTSARWSWSGTAKPARSARPSCLSRRWSTSMNPGRRSRRTRNSRSILGGRQIQGWTNKLIWGDNKLILSSLKSGALRRQIEDAGGLKLIYIDPPFDVGADFSMDIEIGGRDFPQGTESLGANRLRATLGDVARIPLSP